MNFRLALFVLFGGQLLTVSPADMAYAQADSQAEQGRVETADPETFIVDLVDKLRVLASSDKGDAERKDSLRTVLAEDMATRRLQAYLLSREQRKALTEEQIQTYNNVFPRYISSAFAGSIDQLVSRTIKVDDVLERRPGDYIVRSKLYSESGQERASLDWRVLEAKGKKQLVDVIVDGLSFNVERRAQFTAIMNKDGFEALIMHMKDVAEEVSVED
jgi:phospholipid transport system substrate-binding protein